MSLRNPPSRAEKFLTRVPELPSWWALFQIIAAAAVAVVLLMSLMSNSTPPGGVTSQPPPPPPPGSGTPLIPTPGPSATSPAQSPSDSAEDRQLSLSDGTTVTVPGRAYDVAERAAVAIYSGTFDGIPVTVTPNPSAVSYPNPQLLGLDVVSASPTEYVFSARVNLEPTKPSSVAVTAVTVVLDNGEWVYAPSRQVS